MSDLIDEVTQMALQLDKSHAKLEQKEVSEDQQNEAGIVSNERSNII